MIDYEARAEERISEAILSLAKNGINNYYKHNETSYREAILYISDLLNLDKHMIDILIKEYNV